MNVIAKHNDMSIAVVGDLHGKWKILQDKIKLYDLIDTIVVQVGDFGVGFGYNDPREPKKEKKRLQLLNTFLEKRGVFLYIISGNHDNPIFFDGKHNLSHIIFMEDYDVVQVGNKKVLGIGGALSIDRKKNPNFPDTRGRSYPGRREGVDWWPETEKAVYNEEELSEMTDIDVVIAHGCPDFAYPPIDTSHLKKWYEYDPELEQEVMEERMTHTKIFNKLNELNDIKYYIYGHYHDHYLETIGTTKFWMVEIETVNELRF